MDLANLELVSQPTAVASSQPLLQSPALARWHLLSLDAPLVAATWMILFAKQAGVHLPIAEPAAMFCVVWSLYATDRLLDAKSSTEDAEPPSPLEARHHFAWRHRTAFLAGIVVACLAATLLLRSHPAGELRCFAILGILLAAWFALIHLTRTTLPKELAVGPFFAAAVSLPVLTRQQAHSPANIILFAALCSLNCIFISAWEDDSPAHPATRWAAKKRLWIALTLGSCAVILHQSEMACAALLLILIDRQQARFERTTLRSLADAALLLPALAGFLWP